MKLALLALMAIASLLMAAGPEAAFDAAADSADPAIAKRATVILADKQPDGTLAFRAVHYRGEGDATDFWPASTIKLYAALAALEQVHGHGLPLDVTVTFEHRAKDGPWVLDSSRTLREMLSEVFRRSSNEDYTLLLRVTGLDRINGEFLTKERGFQHSALMRGYVTGRPWVYMRDEPQRITLRSSDGTAKVIEHTWSGRSWSEERGATVIDAKTGNCTTTGDMARCLQRLLFHELTPQAERFRISQEMADFIRYGGDGLTGMETRHRDSGPLAWEKSGEEVFPKARFFHKCGRISDYVLQLACVDDRSESGRAVILAAAAHTGSEDMMRKMCRALLEWAKAQPPVAAHGPR